MNKQEILNAIKDSVYNTTQEIINIMCEPGYSDEDEKIYIKNIANDLQVAINTLLPLLNN